MSQLSKSPAVFRAYTGIKLLLRNADSIPGSAIPSVSKLARSLDVSRVSVIRAIALLKTEGVVSGGRHSRIRVGPAISPAIAPADNREAWRHKRALLESDILSGRYADQKALPSFKILQERYGGCFRTMRKVARSLLDDGVVTLAKKKFEVVLAAGRSPGKRIVIIVNRSAVRSSSALNQGQYRIRELFEQESFRRGLVPVIVEMDLYNPVEVRQVLRSRAFVDRVEGFVIDLWWYESREFLESYGEILSRLSTLKCPVTILDEIGEARLPDHFSSNPSYQIFRIEGRRAGSSVARMLISEGHVSVVYVSAFHNQPYSAQRLEGIVDQFAQRGGDGRVVPVVTDKIEQPFGYVLALSGLDDATLRKVIGIGRTASQASDLHRVYLGYRRRLASLPIGSKGRAAIKRNLSALGALTRRNLDEGYFEHACRAMLDDAEKQLVGLSVRSLFDQALTVNDATVWICATDSIALAAISFLREKGIAVPKKISVVGFDNDPVQAIEKGLTTYDFNAYGFVHAMLTFIARPSRPRGGYSHRAIEVAGAIIRRSTVASREGSGKPE